MKLLIEDTARNNLASWTADAVNAGAAAGAVISPFATPRVATNYKQSGVTTAKRLTDDGAEVWFDPMTHALQMPNAGDLRYYDEWDLWGGTTGALRTDGDRDDHVSRVFAIQDTLSAAHLAPTVLLHSAQSTTSQRALDLAKAATKADPDCVLSVAGDSAFWSAGRALDAHIGALAQLQPAGWSLVVVRSLTVLPVAAAAEEVHGLCRTVRSLRDDGPVHISYGDFAALPAVVAGATSIGTGWDARQRVCAYESYVERTVGGSGGQWLKRPAFQGLIGLLANAPANDLVAANAPLATKLLPGTLPPDAEERFLHHCRVLMALGSQLTSADKAAYDALRALYAAARTSWALAAAAAGFSDDASAWFGELEKGLKLFGATEGW
jgi:hypothetical protein